MEENNKFSNLELEEYKDEIDYIIKNTSYDGKFNITWEKMNQYIQYKLSKIVDSFEEEININKTEDNPDKNDSYSRFLITIDLEDIFSSLKKLKHTPFTIQRICEMLIDPMKYYKSRNKFLFAFIKLVDI